MLQGGRVTEEVQGRCAWWHVFPDAGPGRLQSVPRPHEGALAACPGRLSDPVRDFSLNAVMIDDW